MIRLAFADVPRPDDAGLVHPSSHDGTDLEVLHGVEHWEDLDDSRIRAGYSALSFLSPEGFRHFIPAFMVWVLQHPTSAAAVIDSTVWAFDVELYPDELRPYVASHWSMLDEGQRVAVRAFLSVMAGTHPDAGRTRDAWQA